MAGTYVIVDRQRRVLRTAHLAVFVALAETVRARSVAELRRLREEFCRVLVVDKHDVVYAALVQEREFVQRVWELRRGVLGGALEPLDALLRPLRQAQFAVEFREAEAVERTGMGRRSGLAVELHGLRGLPAAAPAVLAARPGAVRGVWVAVLGGEDEERERTVKVLAVLVRADAVRVAVGKEILRGHVPAVRVALQERRRLLDEILPLFDRLFDLHDVARRELRDGQRL